MIETIIGQTIGFADGEHAHEFLLHGWSRQEPHHIWTLGRQSALTANIPDAPNGFFLEISWLPALVPPFVAAQPVTISVDGEVVWRGDVRDSQVAAFRCEAPRGASGRVLITIDHPNAVRPRDFGGGDSRELALAFQRVRVLVIAREEKSTGRRRSNVPLGADNITDLAKEVEHVTGLPIADLLPRFEMLCGNCDMGVAGRIMGVEPLSLLRFAGAYPAVSIKGLDTRFEGIGQDIEPFPWHNGEWMMRDRYGLCYHTGQAVQAVTRDRLIVMERRRIGFLKRKFLEDLEHGGKIFVLDRSAGDSLPAAMALFLALNRDAPRTLLWVAQAARDDEAGSAQEVVPGLILGYLGERDPPLVGHISIKGWMTVLANAHLLARSTDMPRRAD